MRATKTVTVPVQLAVPEWAKWIACDNAGCFRAYANKPIAGPHGWELDPENEHDYLRVMVAEAVYWWTDVAAAPVTYDNWREMLWGVQP
jgi:hypothetical protein